MRRDPESHRQCVRLFRTLLGKTILPAQVVLLEFTCYLITGGYLREAFDNLAGYVYRSPFKYNSAIHGYYGLIALTMWQAAEEVLAA